MILMRTSGYNAPDGDVIRTPDHLRFSHLSSAAKVARSKLRAQRQVPFGILGHAKPPKRSDIAKFQMGISKQWICRNRKQK